MKKTSLFVAVALTSVGFSSPLLAEVYLGGKLGLGLIDDACSASGPCDDDALGYGVYGGYHFTERWGLELGFDSIGEFESSHYYNNTTKYVDSRLTALSLTPRYTFSATDTIDVFLKAGAAYMDYDRANDTVFTAGLGSELSLSESLALRLEYQYFDDINDSYIHDLSSHFISLGLTYTFGNASKTTSIEEEEEVELIQESEKKMAEPMEEKPMEPVAIKQEQSKSHQNLFKNNGSELAPESHAELDSIAAILIEHPQATVNIVGHTDSSGSEAYNQKISEDRAKSVSDYLQEKGVKKTQINARGEGESNPIATNKTAEGRSANRRVDIEIPNFEY
ncbi:OmpA family protein [Aliivibrio fischeri]|uniref:OmpA family protein n=1 Tax=Aliivibrio fischeri TaxID=668 RepID=UPI0012DAC197|nr:OmpA family protein [Aliivibrio fischeri]MUJ37912.1 OmpA family protein [Aliivibrio fischeri]